MQEEIDGINNEIRITNAYQGNSDGCENTIFKQERYSFYKAENRRVTEKRTVANLKMARINKYIAILNANLGTDCVNKNALDAEIKGYLAIVWKEAGIEDFPIYTGWGTLEAFDYLNYEEEYTSLIPCTNSAESFQSQKDSLDIFSTESRFEFQSCTGKRFSKSIPTEAPVYEYFYEEPIFDDENLNFYYEEMQANIIGYYSGLIEYATLKEQVDAINKLNTISLTHSQCDLKITEHPDSIANLERQIVQWTKQQVDLDLYDDFWSSYAVPSQGSTRITNRTPWFYYNVANKDDDVSTVTEEGRLLAGTYVGDDFIVVDNLGPNDGPSRITTCTENDILTGF